MFQIIIRAAMYVLAGIGVGKLADKTLPDQNLSAISKEPSLKGIAVAVLLSAVGAFILRYVIRTLKLSRTIKL
jgi:hypothetical protein